MSSSSILTGNPIVSTKRFDSLYTSSGQYQAGPSGPTPSSAISTGIPTFGERYFLSYYPPHAGGNLWSPNMTVLRHFLVKLMSK